MDNGIMPDLVTTLDFRKLNSEKLSPDLVDAGEFALVANIFSSGLTAKRLSPKGLFFSFQENDTQKWLMDAWGINSTMPPVNSVALLSLSLAQMIQADPVILVGYDFALTSKDLDHAKGAVFSYGWHKGDGIEVPGIDGRPVKTRRFLFDFKQNFEAILAREPRSYINATASGAHIEGTRVKSLKAVLDQDLVSPVPVWDIINGCIRPKDGQSVTGLLKAARIQLSLAAKTDKQVKAAVGLNQKLWIAAKKKKKNGGRQKGPGLPENIQTMHRALEKSLSPIIPFIPMEELAARFLDEAEEIRRKLPGAGPIDTLIRDCAVLERTLAGHLHGLAGFQKSIERLTAYLEKEDLILARLHQGKFREKDLVELAGLYAENKDSAKTLRLLDAHGDKFLGSPRVRILKGECHAWQLEFDTAFTEWEGVLEQESGLDKQIGQIRRSMGEYWIQRGINEPLILETCLKRAFLLCREISFFLEYKDTAWPVYAKKINQALAGNQSALAQSLLLTWEPASESIPQWSYFMARLFSDKGEKEKALGSIEKALEKNQNHALWMALHARLLMETGQFDLGISRLSKAVELDPTQALLWEELGDFLFTTKDFTGAAIAYEKCATALPDRADTLKKMGDCFVHLNEIEKAGTVYGMVLEKVPGHEGARAGIAKMKK